MLLYLDTSALVKRYVAEEKSDDVIALTDEAPAIATSLLTVSQGAGVESAGTKSKSRDPRIHRARNAGCSRDSGSNYRTGSRHHRETDLWASIKPYTIALPVSCMRGSGARRVGNYRETQ